MTPEDYAIAHDLIVKALDILPPRQQDIFVARALHRVYSHKLAKEYRVTIPRIWQIEQRALKLVRQKMKVLGIIGFYNV